MSPLPSESIREVFKSEKRKNAGNTYRVRFGFVAFLTSLSLYHQSVCQTSQKAVPEIRFSVDKKTHLTYLRL